MSSIQVTPMLFPAYASGSTANLDRHPQSKTHGNQRVMAAAMMPAYPKQSTQNATHTKAVAPQATESVWQGTTAWTGLSLNLVG